MRTVSRGAGRCGEVSGELALPPRVQEALGELVGSAKEGLLALSVGVGLGVLAELMEEEVDEVVGPKGRHDPRADRGPPRPRERRGDARRAARPGRAAAGAGAPTASSEVPLRTYQHFAVSRPVEPARARADAGRRLHAPLRAHRASRSAPSVEAQSRGRRRSSAVSREFVARTREQPGRADEPPPRRRAAGGADAGRDRAQGPLLRGRARDHDRRRQAAARALGRLDRERDRRDAAALQPRRARPRRRPGRALS